MRNSGATTCLKKDEQYQLSKYIIMQPYEALIFV